ncbi:CDP-alcohol phosphatidyltransferase family protein [Candidatus Pacearchaeota archaeon]|nr:CDP-alcohol phosphatidyltransferase family protein [Candidatus Pacearchaeota archaeon]
MVVKKENIWNVPNFLTAVRFILTFVLVYLFIIDYPVLKIVIVFAIAALTDFLDGQIARGFNQVTRFGAKFDILADRLLWGVFGLCVLYFFSIRNIFNGFHLFQVFLIFSREIFSLPFILVNVIQGKKVLAKARWSGKTTTFLQGFAIPFLVLSSIGYSFFDFSIVLSIACFISGLWSVYDYSRAIGYFGKK